MGMKINGHNTYLFQAKWENDGPKCLQSQKEALLVSLQLLTLQMVKKIYYSILFIVILELLLFYFNLIIFEIQSYFYKVGFIICLYSFDGVGF